MTCELRVILGKARAGAEGFLPDRAPDALRQRDQRRPCLGIVCPGTDHEHRCAGGREELRQSRDGLRVGALRTYDAGGGGVLAAPFGGCSPVVHRHDDEGGAAPGGRLVVGAVDGAGHVLGLQRLVDPDGVLTCDAVQLPGEERLEGEMAPVLLADEHDEGRAIHARGGERADGVSEPCGRVQDRQRRLVPCDRPAGGHAHDGALVQGEHEPEILRQIREQADLRRPRVCEQRGEPAAPEYVERRVANRPRRHRVILNRQAYSSRSCDRRRMISTPGRPTTDPTRTSYETLDVKHVALRPRSGRLQGVARKDPRERIRRSRVSERPLAG